MLNTMKNANTVGSLTEKFMQYTLRYDRIDSRFWERKSWIRLTIQNSRSITRPHPCIQLKDEGIVRLVRKYRDLAMSAHRILGSGENGVARQHKPSLLS